MSVKLVKVVVSQTEKKQSVSCQSVYPSHIFFSCFVVRVLLQRIALLLARLNAIESAERLVEQYELTPR